MNTRLYADHAATTPPGPEVIEAMKPWLGGEYGNPSSLHSEGRHARQAIDLAREMLSSKLGCLFGEFLFTSSGTEAANMAILGTALEAMATRSPRKRVLLGSAEHHCVLHTRETLETLGFVVEFVPVDRFGRVSREQVEEKLGTDVLLVSVIHANNELGSINPIADIADAVKSSGAFFHADAVQTFCTLPTLVDDLKVDLLSVSAHKVYGPKGVGGLYVRSGVLIKPLMIGGGQEREMRAGTENVAGIAGFGAAVTAWEPMTSSARDTFEAELDPRALRSISSEAPRLPGHAHFRVPGVPAETLLIKLDRLGLSASSGAACSSGSTEPSHVLLACGYDSQESMEGVRLSFGRGQGVPEGRRAATLVNQAIEEVLAHRSN